jgi:hypothetical protein
MWHVLFGHGWAFVIDSVAWEDDVGVMLRVLTEHGTTFDRRTDSPDLTAEWSVESSYYCRTPAVVPSLAVAFLLLGCSTDVLDHLPRGPLAPPVRWRLAGKK